MYVCVSHVFEPDALMTAYPTHLHAFALATYGYGMICGQWIHVANSRVGYLCTASIGEEYELVQCTNAFPILRPLVRVASSVRSEHDTVGTVSLTRADLQDVEADFAYALRLVHAELEDRNVLTRAFFAQHAAAVATGENIIYFNYIRT